MAKSKRREYSLLLRSYQKGEGPLQSRGLTALRGRCYFSGGAPMSTAQQAGRALREAQTGMPNFLPFAVFAILLVVSLALAFFVGVFAPVLGVLVGAAGAVLSGLVAASV